MKLFGYVVIKETHFDDLIDFVKIAGKQYSYIKEEGLLEQYICWRDHEESKKIKKQIIGEVNALAKRWGVD